MDKTDSELVRLALGGPGPEAPRAFEELVRRWQDPLFRTVRRRIHDHHEAEDLTFEAFTEAWINLRKFKQDAQFRPWLFGIAWNLMRSWHRERKMKLVPTPVEQALLDAHPVIEDPAIRLDLAEALALVPESTLQILREKFHDHLTYRELEEKHGISMATLHKHIAAGCDHIEAILRTRGLLDRFTGRPDGGPPGDGPHRGPNGNGGGGGGGDAGPGGAESHG